MANNCWYEMKVAGRPEVVESNSEKKIPLDEQLSNAQKRAAEQLQNQNQSVNKEL